MVKCNKIWNKNSEGPTVFMLALMVHHGIISPSQINQFKHLFLPDPAVLAVRILCCYSSHFCADFGVLVYIHDIIIHRENRRFVHISNCYLESCVISKCSQVGEARVQVGVFCCNMQSVLPLLFIVKRLDK